MCISHIIYAFFLSFYQSLETPTNVLGIASRRFNNFFVPILFDFRFFRQPLSSYTMNCKFTGLYGLKGNEKSTKNVKIHNYSLFK